MGGVRQECLDFLIRLNEKHFAKDTEGVGGALQSRPRTLPLGSRDTWEVCTANTDLKGLRRERHLSESAGNMFCGRQDLFPRILSS